MGNHLCAGDSPGYIEKQFAVLPSVVSIGEDIHTPAPQRITCLPVIPPLLFKNEEITQKICVIYSFFFTVPKLQYCYQKSKGE